MEKSYEKTEDHNGPRLSFVGIEEVSDDRERSFLSDNVAETQETSQVSTEIPQTVNTQSPHSSTRSTEHTTSEMMNTTHRDALEEMDIVELGSGAEDINEQETDIDEPLGNDDFFLDKINDKETDVLPVAEANELVEDLEVSETGSGDAELELIITLPDFDGSGSGDESEEDFEITRPRQTFTTGEEVFRALIEFLIPDKELDSLTQDDNVAFKDLFNLIAA